MISKMIISKQAWVCLVCSMALANGLALAADPPDAGAIQRLERERLERFLQDKRLSQPPVRPEVGLPATPAADASSLARNIPVKMFDVDASLILSAEEIHTALAPYENRTLSLADLFEAVAALNKLYADKHMPTARAFLPPQDIKDGIVKIRLIEAHVGQIKLSPLKNIVPTFIEKRISLAPGDLMSVTQLEADLVRFNRLHGVQLRASVQPGSEVGTTDVVLNVVEPDRLQLSVFVDNAGRYSVGEERVGVSAKITGLTGHDDNLLFSASKSRGSNSYYLGYSLPLTRNDLRLDVAYSQGDIRVIKGDFAKLDVSGRSREVSFGLTQPIVVDAENLWNVYGRAAHKSSLSAFGGEPQLQIDLVELSLGISGEHQTERSAWTLDANVNQGVRKLGSEENFLVLRANAAWLGRFGTRAQLVLRGGLQYSPTELLPSMEQFQLGGNASVRGYSEGLLSGRSGYLTSAEVRYALQNPQANATRNANIPLVSGFLFVDHGAAFPYRPTPLNDVTKYDFLTGAGFGLVADWKSHITARLALGWALQNNPVEKPQRSPRLHGTVSYNWP